VKASVPAVVGDAPLTQIVAPLLVSRHTVLPAMVAQTMAKTVMSTPIVVLTIALLTFVKMALVDARQEVADVLSTQIAVPQRVFARSVLLAMAVLWIPQGAT